MNETNVNSVNTTDTGIRDKIQTIILSSYVSFGLRLLLGMVFIYAGIVKLAELPEMAVSVNNYRLLPDYMVNVVAMTLPGIEVIAGICLIAGLFTDGALTVVTAMLIAFVIAVESAILRGLDIECGCFSTSDAERVGIQVLLRDVLLLLATVPIWMARKQILMLDHLLFSKHR